MDPYSPQPPAPNFQPTPTAFYPPPPVPSFIDPQYGTRRDVPKKRKSLVGAFVALGLTCALIGGVTGAVGSSLANPTATGPNITISSDGTGTITTTTERAQSDLADVVKEKLKSVVTVSAVGDDTGGTGSGVILNTDGYIVTNAHVATLGGLTEDAAITVQTNSGTVYEAKLVGYDATADLAVLKVDKKLEGTEPIKFASSDALTVGSSTIAIGAPLGLSGTVTTGIVSALNRPITVASSQVPGGLKVDTGNGSIALSVIQTDAAINPGNSGGALLDANGNLIGINVAIATSSSGEESGSIGVGFAIPSDYVQRISAEIIATGYGSHGYLGANINDFAVDDAAFTSGAEVVSTAANSPASKAGLLKGDVIVKLNGSSMASSLQLTATVRQYAPNSEVEVTYLRNGKEEVTTVKLGTA